MSVRWKLEIPAKCLLFGEHFVFHGVPALGVAIGLYERFEFVSEGTATKRIRKTPLFERIRRSLPIEQIGCEGILEHYGNVGSSANLCIALQLIDQLRSNDRLSDLTELEFIHRCLERAEDPHRPITPTDIISILHGLAIVQRVNHDETTSNVHTRIGEFSIHHPITSLPTTHQILMINDFKTPSTDRMIRQVRRWSREHPNTWSLVRAQMLDDGMRLEQALEHNDADALQEIMYRNEQILEQLKLVPSSSQLLINELQLRGISSAKLTGACGGGPIIALVERGSINPAVLRAQLKVPEVQLFEWGPALRIRATRETLSRSEPDPSSCDNSADSLKSSLS